MAATIYTTMESLGLDAASMLVEVNKAIKAILIAGQSYNIGSRSLSRANITELKNLRDELYAEVAAENTEAGAMLGTTVAVFMGTGR